MTVRNNRPNFEPQLKSICMWYDDEHGRRRALIKQLRYIADEIEKSGMPFAQNRNVAIFSVNDEPNAEGHGVLGLALYLDKLP